jgi:hypothetical protein
MARILSEPEFDLPDSPNIQKISKTVHLPPLDLNSQPKYSPLNSSLYSYSSESLPQTKIPNPEMKTLLEQLDITAYQNIPRIDHTIPVKPDRKYITGTYTGQIQDNTRTGAGIFAFANGEEYHGSWLNDLPSGYGLLKLAENTVYEGEFADGLFHGDGKYKSPKGSYEGTWKNGLQDGAGKEIIGKFEYNGGFSDGKRHGLGTARFDSLIFEGKWRNGDFVKGKVREKEENECLGEGRWRKGKLKRFSIPVEGEIMLKVSGKDELTKGKLECENRNSADVRIRNESDATVLRLLA